VSESRDSITTYSGEAMDFSYAISLTKQIENLKSFILLQLAVVKSSVSSFRKIRTASLTFKHSYHIMFTVATMNNDVTNALFAVV
jgi:hypothetical protein